MKRLAASVLFMILIGSATSVYTNQMKELQWNDLVGIFEFEDPFEKLTDEQRRDLGIYARYIRVKESDPSNVTQGMEERSKAAISRLKAEGVDLDYLTSIAVDIMQKRMKKASAVVQELHGQHVKLPGYLLPLEFDEKKVTEFLLVPWFGACIHTPPPPPNQIVFVTAEKGYGGLKQFSPVWVWGEIKVKNTKKSLFLVDGDAGIDTGYTLIAEKVTPYKVTADN